MIEILRKGIQDQAMRIEDLKNLHLLKQAGKQTGFNVFVTAKEGQQFMLENTPVTIEPGKIGVSIVKQEGKSGDYGLFQSAYRFIEISSKVKKSK